MKKQKYKKKGVNQRMNYILLPGPVTGRADRESRSWNPKVNPQYQITITT
jgi:hypothetical protein